MACFRWNTACEDAPASRAMPSAIRSFIPWVMKVRAKKSAPLPSPAINSSSCSIWSLSLIASAVGCNWQASRTVFIAGSPSLLGAG